MIRVPIFEVNVVKLVVECFFLYLANDEKLPGLIKGSHDHFTFFRLYAKYLTI